jgi:hypothetical protein
MMLKRIVMQVSGRVMAQFTTVYLRLITCLSRIAKHLLALITQTYLSVLTPLNLLRVQTVSSFKAWVANLTIAVQSIKRVLSTAKAKVIQIGLQLQTTAHQTLQRANLSQLQNKGLVAKIKLALLRLKGNSYALVHTVRRWIQGGLKLLGAACQHLKRVQHRLFKGR